MIFYLPHQEDCPVEATRFMQSQSQMVTHRFSTYSETPSYTKMSVEN